MRFSVPIAAILFIVMGCVAFAQSFPTAPISGGSRYLITGCKGDGVTDDTNCVQAGIEAACAGGYTLNFDSNYLYNVPGGLTVDCPILMQGPFRYGIWTTTPNNTGRSCPWGLTNKSFGTKTMLNVTAITATIRGLCIDMTAGNVTTNPTAGAAIALGPPTTSTYQSGVHIEQNTILQPFDGITIDGVGYASGCCGQGTSADPIVIAHNTIVSPANVGIEVGFRTANAATVGITVTDNAIVCNSADSTSVTNGVGIALFDGAVYYDGTQNGPEGCNIGTRIAPGTLSGQSQNAEFNGDGVFGDQSRTHDLLIQPGAGGVIDFLTIGGKGPWASATGNVNSVLIDCSASGASCQEFTFSGLQAHGGNGLTQPIVDIEGAAGGPYDLTIVGSNFCEFGTPGSGASALKLNIPAGATGSGRWNIVGNRMGTGCPGSALPIGILLQIATPQIGIVTIEGNDISLAATPISYTPNPTDVVVIENNMGVSNVCISDAAASTLNLDGAVPCYLITGSGTISSIVGPWQNRQIKLLAMAGFSLATGGGSDAICTAASVANGKFETLIWQQSATCWSISP
jgi:hypothetical protein